MLVLFASHPLCWNRRFVANEGFLTQKTRGENTIYLILLGVGLYIGLEPIGLIFRVKWLSSMVSENKMLGVSWLKPRH